MAVGIDEIQIDSETLGGNAEVLLYAILMELRELKAIWEKPEAGEPESEPKPHAIQLLDGSTIEVR